MKDQHKLIKGYRDLSQEEIDLMNEIKALAEQVGELTHKVWLKTCENTRTMHSSAFDEVSGSDIYRADIQACRDAEDWVIFAKKDLQLGFMQLTRAVAKPSTF